MKEIKGQFRRKVMRDSFWSLSSSMIARVGGLIFTIIAARFLMPEGFGIYNLAFSVAIIFMTFIDLGINNTMIRFVSAEIGKNKKKAAAYFQYLFRIKVILSLIFATILLLSSYPLANYLFKKPELFVPLILFSIYMLIFSVESIFEASFYVKNKVSYIAIKEATYQSLRILTLVLVIYLFSQVHYVIGAIVGLLVTIFLVLILVLFLYRKDFEFLTRKQNVYIDKKRVLKFVGFLTISNLSNIFFSYMDTIMLGIFLSAAYIGFYKASIGLIFAITGTLSFSGIFLSALAKIKRENLQSSFDKILKYLLVLIIPAITGIFLLARYVLVFVYGYDYLKAITVLYILTPLIFFVVMVSLFSSLLSSKEQNRELAFLTVVITAINILLIYIFIKIFLKYSEISATAGVALAMLISWIIYFAGILILAKTKLNIHFKASLLIKPVIASLIMAAFLYLISPSIKDMSIISGALEVIGGAAIYFGIMVLIKGIKLDELLDAFGK